LNNGATTIPVSQISWTSSALGNAAADIPAGTFTGSTQFLANIARNTWVENCFTYSYANTAFVAAGIYTARAVFTLLVP
jgi:glutamate-1-semialdehyde aminotransferase